MNRLTLLTTFAIAAFSCHGRAPALPGHVQIDVLTPALFSKGKLMQAYFISTGGSPKVGGAFVYYEYNEDGVIRQICNTNSLPGISAVLACELPSPADATTLETRIPKIIRIAFFNGRLQIQILDSKYATDHYLTTHPTEQYTADYLKRESQDPKAVIEGNRWKLKFRLIEEGRDVRIQEWQLEGALAPFEITESVVRLLPLDTQLNVYPHL